MRGRTEIVGVYDYEVLSKTDTLQLHNLYASLIIMAIKTKMKCLGHAAYMRETRNAYNILVRKSEGKIPLDQLGHK